MNELLDMGVIPIVNENDTLAVAEIKFGDNDTLSAITAAMVHADFLFLMTDVDCLYDKNPRAYPDAQPIEVVEDIGSIQADGELFDITLGSRFFHANVFEYSVQRWLIARYRRHGDQDHRRQTRDVSRRDDSHHKIIAPRQYCQDRALCSGTEASLAASHHA